MIDHACTVVPCLKLKSILKMKLTSYMQFMVYSLVWLLEQQAYLRRRNIFFFNMQLTDALDIGPPHHPGICLLKKLV